MLSLTIPRLLHIMPAAPAADWIEALEKSMRAYGVDTVDRMAMYLANVAWESTELTHLEESFNYSPERLLVVFPAHVKDLADAQYLCSLGAQAIGNRVYGGREGNDAVSDGWLFRGRGPNQLTFENNYRAVSKELCGDDTLLENPEFLCTPQFGAAGSCFHWSSSGCNEIADVGDFDGCCDMVQIGHKTKLQGDAAGFERRQDYLKRAVEALA